MRSVVLVEDHAVVRENLRYMLNLQKDLEVIGETGNGREAVELISAVEPDVVVVDLTLPGLHGLGVIRQVSYQAPNTRMVVLTMHNRNLYVRTAIRNGADGYVLKDDSYDCVLEAIYAPPSERPYLSPHVGITSKELREDTEAECSLCRTGDVLTPREKEVLFHVGSGNTLTQVAEKLSISPRTVEVHSRNIRSKLDLDNTHEMVRWAVERGFIPGEDSYDPH